MKSHLILADNHSHTELLTTKVDRFLSTLCSEQIVSVSYSYSPGLHQVLIIYKLQSK